jgi:hypothetical protein
MTENKLIVVRTRLQLLWMDFSVARAYYERYVLPVVLERYRADRISRLVPKLQRIEIERENYHCRLVSFVIRLTSPCPPVNQPATSRYTLRNVELLNPSSPPIQHTTVAQRMATLAEALRRIRQHDQYSHAPIISPTTCFDFWETEAWWRTRVGTYWYEHPYRRNARRVTHMLNQLMRVLRQAYRRDTASGLQILHALTPRQIDLLDRVFVEPINGSLIASHLSTIFMHNKQQTGLNMKHEANKLFTLATRNLQSERDFDPKIYLKMCTSCVGREIFELMILVRLSHHRHMETDEQPPSDDHRRDYIFCRCPSCVKLRNYANAWRYYDCEENVWIRFEFPRKAYQAVTEVLLKETRDDAMQLIFTSDKNEFHEKRLFVDNFVNYYVFYENGQHPLVISQCTGNMRNTVSVLFVFAIINWVMIVDSRERKSNNSISLNQQSLCKSLNNTVYSIFSENCINRVQCEKTRRVIRENSAYINRGLGMVPNTGINAFHTTHTLVFNE